MHQRLFSRTLVGLSVLGIAVLLMIRYTHVQAQEAEHTPAIQDEAARAFLTAELATSSGPTASSASPWQEFDDQVFGYSVQMPSDWQAQQGDGQFGSVTIFAPGVVQAAAALSESVQIVIGVAAYDRNPATPLESWVTIPDDLSSLVQIDTERSILASEQVVIKTYKTGEGTVRRAFVGRGTKVYFVDMLPDTPSIDATYAYMLLSLVFTDPIMRSQPQMDQLHGDNQSHLYLPTILSPVGASVAVASASFRPSVVPNNYRLPFVGLRTITSGPGCYWTHQGNDFEAIDFGLPSGTSVYAAEQGSLTRFPDLQGYGNTVKISHSDGRISWYSHVREFVAPNGAVSRGSLIAYSGGAASDPGHGTSTGAHLHFMVLAPGARQTEWIRTLPGIRWYSQDSNSPCNVPGKADGEADGPPLDSAPAPSCSGPALYDPGDGYNATNAEVRFRWAATSCASNGYRIRVRTGADMESGGLVIGEATPRTTEWSTAIPSRWFGQTLYWSVRAEGAQGATWSPSRQFRINAPQQTCAAPGLQFPGEGATFAGATVNFGWNDVTCSHNGFTFRIKTVSDMESGGDTVVDTGNGTTQRSETIDSRWYNRDLYWSVRAANAPSAQWAASRRFRISPPAALNRPSLNSPGNNVSLSPDTDITFVWNAASGATQYKLELWGGAYSVMTLCDWQSATSCHAGRMWPGAMSWRVKARDGSGRESDWSDTWSVTVAAPPPTATSTPPIVPTATPTHTPIPTSTALPTFTPTATTVPSASSPGLSSPGNGASMPQSTDVILVWNSAANAVQYQVELWGGPYQLMTPCNWQAGTTCHIGQMWPGTMSWRVRARNSAGQESAWSSTWSFTVTEPATPTSTPTPAPAWRPTLSSPSNGALLPRSTDVTLRWDSLSSATQYKVEVWGGVYQLMTPCDWQSGTSCHIGQMWPGNVLWHVKARTSSGTESAWSEEWNFTIMN